MHNCIQSINSKLLTQENTSKAILTRMGTISADIISLKKENKNLRKALLFNNQMLLMILLE